MIDILLYTLALICLFIYFYINLLPFGALFYIVFLLLLTVLIGKNDNNLKY